MSETTGGDQLDASGCLTPAGIAAVRAAPPGEAPEPLARHLSACPRCQERALAGGVPRGPRRTSRPALPSPGRLLVLLLALLAAMAAFFITLRQLTGPR